MGDKEEDTDGTESQGSEDVQLPSQCEVSLSDTLAAKCTVDVAANPYIVEVEYCPGSVVLAFLHSFPPRRSLHLSVRVL